MHGDVASGNVLFSWRGEVKLADFGVAQVLEGGAMITTSTVRVPA